MPVPIPSPSERDRVVRRVRRARTVLVGGAATAALALGSVLGLQSASADTAGTSTSPSSTSPGSTTPGSTTPGSTGASSGWSHASSGGSTLVAPGSGSASHATSQGS